MTVKRLLIANRGEIAIRIARAAGDLGLETVMVFSTDDVESTHVAFGTIAFALEHRGPAAYLDGEGLVAAALSTGCDAIHPGYGFLSENGAFAGMAADAGLVFVGPSPQVLDELGDKLKARGLARECGVPVGEGSDGPCTVDVLRRHFASADNSDQVIIKPTGGGGGRGMAIVSRDDDLEQVFARCQSEARAAFGRDDVYFERLIRRARHIEVQVVGDGRSVIHLWDRDCTLQRRHQKLVEIAPAPDLDPSLRERIIGSAVTMAEACGYSGLATFEFLVDEQRQDAPEGFVFLEANPRLQVEHTVTEEITGVDLVRTQIQIAAGSGLADLGLDAARIPEPRGMAIQLRVNAETVHASGEVRASTGFIQEFRVPTGPGVRVDTCAEFGFTVNPAFDSLIAKIIVHVPSPELAPALSRGRRALAEFRTTGLATNAPFLERILAHPEVQARRFDTGFVDRHLPELAEAISPDPLAAQRDDITADSPGVEWVLAPMPGVVVDVQAEVGQPVQPGDTLFRVEAMKMEHPVVAQLPGVVQRVVTAVGQPVNSGDRLLSLAVDEGAELMTTRRVPYDLDAIRPDLAKVAARVEATWDSGRPKAVARRHGLGMRTARENIADLVDPGSFSEYGGLVVAAQRARRSREELVRVSPADGFVCGTATINADLFPDGGRAAVGAYDWTVFGGTQGMLGHKKLDRMLLIAHKLRLPIVLFAEGGGGRPGETEYVGASGNDVMSFWYMGRMRGVAPTIGIANRYCFAGNAAMLTMCDVVIATENSNIGMGGPAMIDAGGLGKVDPAHIGPARELARLGVVHLLVTDEAEATKVARRCLSYFQGPVADFAEAGDQRLLRHVVPENRKHPYQVRDVLHTLADADSVLELKAHYGVGVVTALARLGGRPVGIVANNPLHLGGAMDADAAEKFSEFMLLCDRHGLPIVILLDTPGFMVGPQAEATGQARRFGELFITGAKLSVPAYCVVLRKAYGLGADAAATGSLHAPVLTLSWPTGEFGGMGVEGAVHLAYDKELARIEDETARQEKFEDYVAGLYAQGEAISAAEYAEVDAVIDPADTRDRLIRALKGSNPC